MAEDSKLPDTLEDAHALIRDLRKENGGRRTKLRAFEQAFEGFEEKEVAYLLDHVATLGRDLEEGAKAFRDMARDLLPAEKFLEGIELPAAEKPKDEKDEKDGDVKDVKGLSIEDLQAELDRREAEREQKAAARQTEAEEQAAIEAIFAEVEAQGFKRGSRGFNLMLERGVKLAKEGEAVDFSSFASEVRAEAIAQAKAEADELAGEPAPEAEKPAEEPAPKFPASADLRGAGAGAPTDGDGHTDWAAKMRAEGASPEAIRNEARERADRRMTGLTSSI